MVRLRGTLRPLLVAQVIIALALFTICFDIPVARQIVGFVCISFVPGFLISKILRLSWKTSADMILFSVALSVAFLMFVGLFINASHFVLGVPKPLSEPALAITIGVVLEAMCLIAYWRGGPTNRFPPLAHSRHLLRASLFIIIPILAILGAWLTRSSILLLMAVAIALLPVLITLSKRAIPIELFPFVLFIVAVSLLLHVQLVSPHLTGWDVFDEYYAFNLAKSNSFWSPSISFATSFLHQDYLLTYNAMLSVTILPATYSALLNTQGEWIFKIVYYILFALVPVSLYQTYGQKFGKLTTFLAVFYFTIVPRFYHEERRQMIGELFYALLILLTIRGDLKGRKKLLLWIVFAASLVVSHYSLSYVYLYSIAFAFCFISLMKFAGRSVTVRELTGGRYVLLFFLMCFSWYTYVSAAPSNVFWGFIDNVSGSFFVDLLNIESRGVAVSSAISRPFSSLHALEQFDVIVSKLPYFFILAGLVLFFRKYKQRDFDWEYALMAAANALIVLMVLVVPQFGPSFEPERFYHVSLFFLAPLCIVGGRESIMFVLRPFRKVVRPIGAALIVLSLLLSVIYLFRVGFINEIAGEAPVSESISFMRMKTSKDNDTKVRFYEPYVPEQDVFGAIWLSKMAREGSDIYADYTASLNVLRAYGMVMLDWEHVLTNRTNVQSSGYIYLRSLNVQGLMRDRSHKFAFLEINGVRNSLDRTNRVYSNGLTQILGSIDLP